MSHYKITLEYDGTGLSGWQRQNNHPSVQQLLEEAIYAFAQENISVTASGRTDAGVHARGQVVNFALEKEFTPYQIMHGINFHLRPAAITVLDAKIVDGDFNARFSAKKRTYCYHIINRPAPLALDRNRAWQIHEPLDIEAMQKAAGFLIGNHDFTSFRAAECQSKSPVKTLDEITIKQDDENILITVTARSFLHHMMRNIVGTLKLVGCGKWQPDDVEKALAAKDRKAAGPTAPAHGLYFMKVLY